MKKYLNIRQFTAITYVSKSPVVPASSYSNSVLTRIQERECHQIPYVTK